MVIKGYEDNLGAPLHAMREDEWAPISLTAEAHHGMRGAVSIFGLSIYRLCRTNK